MQSGESLLQQPVERAARVVALDLVSGAAKHRSKLEKKRSAEALHDFRVDMRRLRSWLRAFDPWLRDSVPRKARRRLKKAARSTNAARDADARVIWFRSQRPSLTARERPALTWLLKRIRKERDESFDGDVIDGARAFDKSRRSLDRTLREYLVVIDDDDDRPLPFGTALGELMREHTADLRRRLKGVRASGNARQIHVARISAKRLRYLIDPVSDLIPGVSELTVELGHLQDALGDSHDAALFKKELREETAVARAENPGLAPGLRALNERLDERADEAFSRLAHWLDGGAADLLDRVDAIADALTPRRHGGLELVRDTSSA